MKSIPFGLEDGIGAAVTAEGDFDGAVIEEFGGSVEAKVLFVQVIGIKGGPAADQLAAHRGNHSGTVSSLGNRTRL